MNSIRITITGPPKSGKTKAAELIHNALTAAGYEVGPIDETLLGGLPSYNVIKAVAKHEVENALVDALSR